MVLGCLISILRSILNPRQTTFCYSINRLVVDGSWFAVCCLLLDLLTYLSSRVERERERERKLKSEYRTHRCILTLRYMADGWRGSENYQAAVDATTSPQREAAGKNEGIYLPYSRVRISSAIGRRGGSQMSPNRSS